MAALVGFILLAVGLALSFGQPEYVAFISYLCGAFGTGLMLYETFLMGENRRLKKEVKRLTDKYVTKTKKTCTKVCTTQK